MVFKSVVLASLSIFAVSVTAAQSHNIFLGCTDPLATPIRPVRVQADSASNCVEVCGNSASKNTFAYWLGGDESSCVCSTNGPAEEYDIAFPRAEMSHCDDHEVAVFVTKSGHTFQHQPKRSSRSMKSKRTSNTDIDSRSNTSCPEPLISCQIQGDSSNYQCIDPNFSLTSCGGCIHGNFGESATSTAEDCTALPGVAEGGVICSSGTCKAYRCLDGYTLTAGNTCMKA
ncbi:uncharacterized protein IL334_004904 [Kwoniella shivajii]|uniref:Protein CPL1-like domain-containing protein n=1 Tax=Kwoniella shivajii TaxID=564305 RepID=A0ABZ1D1N9_9TREE|nr:hypothetical protein IL334_004904 [Kwoniella shivajii]